MAFAPGDIVAVQLPVPVDTAYDYRLPNDGQHYDVGSVVAVPFGHRQQKGVVVGSGESDLPSQKIKEIIAPCPVPPFPAAMLSFLDWVAAYTLAPRGAVYKMAMSVPAALDPPKEELFFTLADGVKNCRLTGAREKIVSALKEVSSPLSAGDLAEAAQVSRQVISGFFKAGGLQAVSQNIKRAFPQPDPDHPGYDLSDQQVSCAEALGQKLDKGFSVTLLEGVTGSGKTEVYFDTIAKALKEKKQVLVLVPEIALTAQWLGRFERRFGCAPAVWHSDLSPALRRDTWRAVGEGRIPVVIGARSALFLPFKELGLIVVDEEHEQAYKQEEGVLYHARDMAIVRARTEELPILLASATPALETVCNARDKRYDRLLLPTRHGKAVLPEVIPIDMRKNPPEKIEGGKRWLAPPLVAALKETLEKGEQSILFLNRRGYAPLSLCRECGHRLTCPHCTAWLVQHKRNDRFVCHHCGYNVSRPEACPDCEAEDSFIPCGPGIERVAEEVECRFPEARVATVASDTVSSAEAVADLVAQVEKGEIDILIGTQMLAKGHHFPNLTCVGVVDADLGLSGGDLRGAERTFQLLHQVAGRAGRGEKKGRVYLQSFAPDHPVMTAIVKGDPAGFQAIEAKERQLLSMPPFGRLAAVIVTGNQEARTESVARALSRIAPPIDGIRVLGPAPAPLSRLKGKYRFRLLMKAPKNMKIQPLIRQWIAKVDVPSSVSVKVDIDPYSFL